MKRSLKALQVGHPQSVAAFRSLDLGVYHLYLNTNLIPITPRLYHTSPLPDIRAKPGIYLAPSSPFPCIPPICLYSSVVSCLIHMFVSSLGHGLHLFCVCPVPMTAAPRYSCNHPSTILLDHFICMQSPFLVHRKQSWKRPFQSSCPSPHLYRVRLFPTACSPGLCPI